MSRLAARRAGWIVAIAAMIAAADADAAPRRPAVLLPTAIVEDGARRLPDPAEQGDARIAQLAGSVDALLTDTAQDLGLSLDLTGRASAPEAVGEIDLPARARAAGTMLLAPSITFVNDDVVEVRLELADPASRALRVRVERVAREDLTVRAVVMLRDLVTELDRCAPGCPPQDAAASVASPGVLAIPARSAGRAMLAVNATLYGGLVGYSIQRSSGSDDPRLLYPLLAVGAGIGLGGSIIIAEEWDVGQGDAWFLSAGAWWPTLAGHLIYEGRFAPYAGGDDEERWTFGLVGGTTGITLATLALTLRGMSDGGALMAHSGGGLGVVLGGLTEVAARGEFETTPFAGMGYGAAFGWLAAAAAATQARPPPSRVLAVDLGALLGGLGGAALGSPLVFDAPNEDQQRAWVGATAGGLLVGAGVAWFVTRTDETASAVHEPVDHRARPSWVRVGLPMIGVVAESVVGRRRAPALGLGLQGAIE